MGRRVWVLSLTTLGALVVLAVWTATASAAVYVAKPALSKSPTLGVAFSVSGVTTPTAKAGVSVVVKIKVLAPNASGTYVTKQTLSTKVVRRSGKPGYRYSVTTTRRTIGLLAFRAYRYANGRLVGRSAIRYTEVTYGSALLAHWKFNASLGTVAADAVGDLDGALEGPPTWTAGKVRGALSFDAEDGVRVTDAGVLRATPITLVAWVCPSEYLPSYNEVMIIQRDTGSYRGAMILFVDGSGRPAVEFQNGSTVTAALSSPTPLAVDHWAFVAASYDGAVIRLLVNGVETAHLDYAGGIDWGLGPWELHIGGDLHGYPAPFHGLIDEPAVLARALQ
jgi:hypothetical protein